MAIAALFLGVGVSYGQTATDTSRCRMIQDSLTQMMICGKPDKMPEFKKGGNDGLGDYIGRHLMRRVGDIDHEIIIFITFVVGPDGTVSHPTMKFTRPDLPDGLRDRALKLFNKLPPYKPALCDGQPVAARVIQPVVLTPLNR